MRALFVVGVMGLVLFEVANIYFIMPFPGSQRMRSVDLAYELHVLRWWFRVALVAGIALGLLPAWRTFGRRRWLVPAALAVTAALVWMLNFRMAADQLFREPATLRMEPASSNDVALDRLVVGVAIDGEARAYPLQFIGYHHQVRDSIAGRAVLVSYCTVCRTARVFAPIVEGSFERFRLVGMDHFNAMLEDRTTGSWWRQANGEAITGPRKGMTLPEIPSLQLTLARWLALHPHSLVMQADPRFVDEYARDYAFERGTSRSPLTGTDTVSWRDKSWVVGVTVNGISRAYDWNDLERARVIHDVIGRVPVLLVLARDSTSFFAFVRTDSLQRFELHGDSLVSTGRAWGLDGREAQGVLRPMQASQEFWHSWREFQPATTRYHPGLGHP